MRPAAQICALVASGLAHTYYQVGDIPVISHQDEMLTNLGAVVERLIAAYDPERIILFGSHATGRAQAGSDIDLVILKESDKIPIDRRIKVEQILSDRLVPFDLLVYTPQAVWDLYAASH